ncbi:biopolymer transport protein ExbD [Roseovarius pacificus]|uniref:Biopolymer transport protein ExbD n=1 Tax=Roseovarius pacificus TaxID=337701 RepID=A0A1M7A4L3_9RHOB|nr:biopolymer transporter ExbD [Roseovarius pacificus]GGO53887.1 hypothetical protein GCM10011315_12780 [Roseovarius pacificus]SHL37674.1 biopolymer transport protein ExbD [Roseovarius pacificus]
MIRVRKRPTREPTIALINIVFLMLVFFMVAGTLAQPMDGDLSLVRTEDLEGRAPPDALVVHDDGRLSYRGEDIDSVASFFDRLDEANRTEVRLVPDRDLSAETLVAVAAELRGSGAERVFVVTERGLE